MSWITTTKGKLGIVNIHCGVCHSYIYEDQGDLICSKRKRNVPEDLLTLKEVQEHSTYHTHQYKLNELRNKYKLRFEQIHKLLSPLNIDEYQPEINKLNRELEIMDEQINLTEEESKMARDILKYEKDYYDKTHIY